MAPAALAVAAIAATVIGAGVSAYGSYQSGQTQNAIAQFNANNQAKQAQVQALSMQTQAALQEQQAQTNFQLQKAQATQANNNASAIENQALNNDAIERVNIQRNQYNYAQMQAAQRANIAASGVAESSGTPLDILAETASRIQMQQQDSHYQESLQRNTLFNEAANERLGGRLGLAGATMDLNSGLAQATLNDAASRGAYIQGMNQSALTGLYGGAAATAGGYQAGATLLSGVGSAAGMGSQYLRYQSQ